VLGFFQTPSEMAISVPHFAAIV